MQYLGCFNNKLSVEQYKALDNLVSKGISAFNWVYAEQSSDTGWRNQEGNSYIGQLQAAANEIKNGNVNAKVSGTANIAGFAGGGYHSGGLRLVGENGPELEVTGPSRIFSNSQTKSMLDNSDLIAEVKALREEVRLLRQDQRAQSSAVAENTKNTVKQMQRWDIDGIPVKTNDPISVVIA